MKTRISLHQGSTCPVLLVLLAGVLAPTACVLWFASAAMRNERLAVRERLTDVYRRQLEAAQGRLNAHWEELERLLDEAAALPPALAFEKVVLSGLADGAFVSGRDANGGYVHYPVHAEDLRPAEFALPPAWEEAARLEDDGNSSAAAKVYGAVAREANSPDVKAWAILAEARCLSRAGDANAAVAALRPLREANEFLAARDPEGRLIAPNAMLLAADLLPPNRNPKREAVLSRLAGILRAYDGPAMPSSQRAYLMREVRARGGGDFPTQRAEELSFDPALTGDGMRLEGGGVVYGFEPASPTDSAAPGPEVSGARLRGRAWGGKVWTFSSAPQRVAALLGEWQWPFLMEKLGPRDTPGAVTVLLVGAPSGPQKEAFLSLPAGRYLPNGRLDLYLEGPDPFEAATARQNLVYTWTAVLSIAAVCLLAAAAAAYVGRQARLTRLKNDLIATVSHELKTPLASIRVLVDTLLEGRCRDTGQAQEYFRLIARENQRLSHLIDNFLTFSRMERNKRAFDFAPVKAADVVAAAVEAMGERLAPPQCRLDVEVSPDLPPLRADRDALVTVLVNLLDNAWKYTPEPRHIAVRARRAEGGVRLEVADNGIGISRRDQKRIFGRFHQVDQTLSRRAGGCGLGLSIVQFILDSHGGAIEVASEPGKGSTFAVTLPAAPPARPDEGPS